jgi:uncharacterized protein YjbI with pentapeptide repeats
MSACPAEQQELATARLEGANLQGAHLEGAFLLRARLRKAWLYEAHAEGGDFSITHLQKADFHDAHVEGASFDSARLEGATFWRTQMQGANLGWAHLEGAEMSGAHPGGKPMSEGALARIQKWAEGFQEILPPASLHMAFLDDERALKQLVLGDEKYGYVELADVHWGGVNLMLIDWSSVKELGDERSARQPAWRDVRTKSPDDILQGFEAAVRANRQLATVLRNQGMNEGADRFAYRAQVLQRRVLRLQRRIPGYAGSLLLDLISGYGYRPLRAFAACAVVILAFMGLYLLNSHFVVPHLTWDEALVLSMSSFHGRGFFNSGITLGDAYARLAAIEAFMGLLIEVTFIATFTQRFFAR